MVGKFGGISGLVFGTRDPIEAAQRVRKINESNIRWSE